MKISSKAHYGLQAAYILAKRGTTVSAKELEKEIGVSCKYLERIMRILTGAGVVLTARGATGGYYLAKSAEQTTAGEIVRALEDELEIIGCVKNTACSKCSSSLVWKKLYSGINQILNGITLADMISASEESNGVKNMPVQPCTTCAQKGKDGCSCK